MCLQSGSCECSPTTTGFLSGSVGIELTALKTRLMSVRMATSMTKCGKQKTYFLHVGANHTFFSFPIIARLSTATLGLVRVLTDFHMLWVLFYFSYLRHIQDLVGTKFFIVPGAVEKINSSKEIKSQWKSYIFDLVYNSECNRKALYIM